MNACVNGGICVATSATTYVCNCPVGFTGSRCEISQGTGSNCPVTPNPCRNGGTCITATGGGIQCICPVGFTGLLCDSGTGMF